MELVGTVVHYALLVFIGCMWVRFITDWVQLFARTWMPRGALLVALEGVYSATDPPIKGLRRIIPPIRLGSFALDLSFFFVFVGAYVLLTICSAYLPTY